MEARGEVADDIATSGGTAQPSAATSPTVPASTRAVAAAEAALGPIDVLVNNAGWDVFKPFTKTEPAEWDKLIAINLTGALHMHHAVLPGMAARKKGASSTSLRRGARRLVGRGGVRGVQGRPGRVLQDHRARACAPRHHRQRGLPGPTDTALFADYKEGAGNPEKLMEAFTRSIPLGRIGQPDDLPGAILFFASDDAGFITGQVLSVSGGLTMNG